jgi:hypothetical protein
MGCHLRRDVVEFAVSHETHKTKVGIYIRLESEPSGLNHSRSSSCPK